MKFGFVTLPLLLTAGTTCAQDGEAFQNQSSVAEPAPSANELKAKEHVERARDLLQKKNENRKLEKATSVRTPRGDAFGPEVS